VLMLVVVMGVCDDVVDGVDRVEEVVVVAGVLDGVVEVVDVEVTVGVGVVEVTEVSGVEGGGPMPI
jgi:hypothetical protein